MGVGGGGGGGGVFCISIAFGLGFYIPCGLFYLKNVLGPILATKQQGAFN